MKVKITLNEEMLGMSPANADIYREYIASKSPDAATIDEEVASVGVDAVEEKGITVFPRTEDGTPFMWDYKLRDSSRTLVRCFLRLVRLVMKVARLVQL